MSTTASIPLSTVSRHVRTFGKVLLVLNGVFFLWCVADWLGWLPGERGFRPLQTVYMSGALILQSVSLVIQRRSMLATYVLLAATVALLVISR